LVCDPLCVLRSLATNDALKSPKILTLTLNSHLTFIEALL